MENEAGSKNANTWIKGFEKEDGDTAEVGVQNTNPGSGQAAYAGGAGHAGAAGHAPGQGARLMRRDAVALDTGTAVGATGAGAAERYTDGREIRPVPQGTGDIYAENSYVERANARRARHAFDGAAHAERQGAGPAYTMQENAADKVDSGIDGGNADEAFAVKKKAKPRIWLWALCASLCVVLTIGIGLILRNRGGEKPPPIELPPVEIPVDIRTPVIGARVLEDGRRVGGSAKGEIGDEMVNVFFSFCVNDAALVAEFEGLTAERGLVYLVADITVANVFDGRLTIWSSDFVLQWGEGDNEYGYPMKKTSDAQMDDAFSLTIDESIEKKLVYVVPVPADENTYIISYLEFYADEVEGNTFFVIFDLGLGEG